MTTVRLASKTSGTTILVSGKDKGVLRVANTVAEDIIKRTDAVRGSVRIVRSDDIDSYSTYSSSTLIIAGIIGEEETYDKLLTENGISGDLLRDKRECFIVRVISDPAELGRTVILVMGSDKLGAEYGLLHISRVMGISPWHYWADVDPIKEDEVTVDKTKLEITTDEPSVELRGFFLNDEWPSLGSWVSNTFGKFDENFYAKVFDLLLRLRGNFLWPAMWAEVFSEDGTSYPEASADLASELGITMGTSHHEPLCRAGEEFSYFKTDSNDKGYGKDWSYYTNSRGIYRFWEDSIRRNKRHKTLITIGMRGERDSLLLGANATMKDNVELLKKAITDQKRILAENGLKDAPKVLALYKEVEDYYYGDEETEGLCSWSELDDTMLLLSDDNFGNLRTVPAPDIRNRKAGWGIYYHFDYHGDPISYEWVNSTPILKAWDQLTNAYECGIRRLWIVNVGDLKPMEFPLSYFMDLAYDIDTYGKLENVKRYTYDWCEEQFGSVHEECRKGIADLIDSYTFFNGIRRPEATHPDTFSLSNGEAYDALAGSDELYAKADRLSLMMPPEVKDRFYELAEFPAKASANLRRMMILTGLYEIAAAQRSPLTDMIAAEVMKTVESDRELVRKYNEDTVNGKWNGMMSSKHVNFINWNDEGSEYPSLNPIGILPPEDASYEDILEYMQSLKTAADPVAVIEADQYMRSVTKDDSSWITIDKYGKYKSAMKLRPFRKKYDEPETAPYLEYEVSVPTEGEYHITVMTTPANNLYKGEGLRFALSVDDFAPIIVDTLSEGYMAGYGSDKEWSRGVLENERKTAAGFTLAAGKHVVRLFRMDPGTVFLRFTVTCCR